MISKPRKSPFKILVDADSCPVKEEIFRVVTDTGTPVIIIASVSHMMDFEVPNVTNVSVDNSPQAADIAIINKVERGDIVVTGDYGLASIVLSKGAVALSVRGRIFDAGNIDNLLLQRHIEAKIRKGGGKTKGPKAFKEEDRHEFETVLRRIITAKLANH